MSILGGAVWSGSSTSDGPAEAALGPERGRWPRLLGASVWLIFLGNPLQVLGRRLWDPVAIAGIAALCVFVAVYMVGLTRVRWVHLGRHFGIAWIQVIAMLALTGVVMLGSQSQGLTCLVYVAALGVSTLPNVQALGLSAALLVAVAVSGRVVPGWSTHGIDFAIVLASAAVWSFRLAWQRQARLREAERDLSELAIEEERSRIARDLHDILGHSLTVISVKSELAERLLTDDPHRARQELADVQRLARDALADVRATTRGLRGLSLPQEIAQARSALESAGIEPDLPTVTDDVPTQWRELFAWTLREAVTNAIRHSGASRVEVSIDASGLTVLDDGQGCPVQDAPNGTGLDGLRTRAREAGAAVMTGPGRDGRGFELALVVPS